MTTKFDMKRLPRTIRWELVSSDFSARYQEVLFAVRWHSDSDWKILCGHVVPNDNYTDFVLRSASGILYPKNKVLAIGTFCSYSMNTE